MTRKEIVDHLISGGSVWDYQEFEPGMCSNGGHYAVQYRLRSGVLFSLSTYEDATWQEEYGHSGQEPPYVLDQEKEIEGFAEYVLQTWDDECYYITGARWSLDD
jgi:hypothetical protein